MNAVYTIKRAAEIVGVPVATLRAWERRYGVAVPERTDSGYRLYDDAAVEVLSQMQSLVVEGWAPRQAATEVRRRLGLDDPDAVTDPGVHAGAGTDEDLATPGEGDASLASLSTDDAVEQLIRSAAELDVAAVTRLLDARYAAGSFETVTDDWLLPAMQALGLAWADGRVTVAGEHLVAHAVVRKLSAAYEATGDPALGRRVVIGLPPRSRHEIGLLAFAVAARRAGLATVYVGADLPVSAWVTAAQTQGADAVVLAASMESDLEHVGRVVEALTLARPELVVALGGGLQDRTPQECLRLGHRVGEAAAVLARRLTA